MREISKILVGDVGLRIHKDGAGERVLFLHGAGGFPGWLPFFAALCEQFEVIAPDHPGFGASDDPAWIRNVSDLALFYLDLLEGSGWSGVHLMGHSLGGWIAAEIAIRNVSRIKSLTLIAPAGIRVKGLPAGDNFIWAPDEVIRNLYFDQNIAELLLSQPLNEEQMEIALRNRFAGAKYGWQPRWFDPDLEKWLHRAKVPAHIVWGDSDKLFPAAYGAAWRDRLPDARLTVVERCGHAPHVEKPAEVSRSILEFLKTVSA